MKRRDFSDDYTLPSIEAIRRNACDTSSSVGIFRMGEKYEEIESFFTQSKNKRKCKHGIMKDAILSDGVKKSLALKTKRIKKLKAIWRRLHDSLSKMRYEILTQQRDVLVLFYESQNVKGDPKNKD